MVRRSPRPLVPSGSGSSPRYVRCIVLALVCSQCPAADVPSRYDSLYAHILANYNRFSLPIVQPDQTVQVSMTINAVSINDFDQLSGELSMTTLFWINWLEPRVSWNTSDFNNISSVLLPTNVLWYPRIYIQEAANVVQELGSSLSTSFARVFDDGTVKWSFGYIVKVTCSLDVSKFPFDTQQCVLSFNTAVFLPTEVTLFSPYDHLLTDYLSTNSQWEVLHSPVYNNTRSSVTLTLRLKRRTVFYIVYILIPILLLGIINNLVFLLPTSSGERMSVAITIFLSFVVYMDIVNDNVPESSMPMADIYNYLLFLMIYSSATLVCTIVSMRIYDRQTPVPDKLTCLIRYSRFWCCRRTPGAHVHPEKEKPPVKEPAKDNDVMPVARFDDSVSECQENDEVTWKMVSATFDMYCSFALFLIFVIFTVVMFTRLD